MRILIPTAGNRSVLISAFREQTGVERVVTTEIDPLAPGRYFADKCYQVPRSDAPGFLEAMQGICRAEGIDLLFPLADLDLIRFARERGRFASLDVEVWASPDSTIELSMDKWRTYQLFRELEISSPRTVLLAEASRGTPWHQFPVYLKPRHAGMKNSPRYFFKLLESTDELDYYRNRLRGQEDDYLLTEPLFAGREVNVDFFVQDQELKRLVSLHRLKAGDGGGIIRGRTIPSSPAIHEFVRRLVGRLDFQGAANIQLFEFDDGRILVTEINPRFSNSSALVTRPAGVDFFDLTFRMRRGERIVPEFDNYRMISVTSAYQPIIVENPSFDQL